MTFNAHAATVTIDLPGCAALTMTGGPNYQINCAQQGQTCTAQASPANPAAGTMLTLSAACTPAAAVVTWQASRGCTTPTGGATANVVEPAAIICTYTATGNAGGAGSVTVNWQAAPPVVVVPPTNLCASYGDVSYVDLPWGGNALAVMRPDTVIVGRLIVPAVTKAGRWSWVEYDGAPTFRLGTMSPYPCDFRGWTPTAFPTDPSGAKYPMAWGGGQTGDISWSLGTLKPGGTYYFNLRNTQFDGTPSCHAETCNALLTISTF
jgi:hypothetical protein